MIVPAETTLKKKTCLSKVNRIARNFLKQKHFSTLDARRCAAKYLGSQLLSQSLSELSTVDAAKVQQGTRAPRGKLLSSHAPRAAARNFRGDGGGKQGGHVAPKKDADSLRFRRVGRELGKKLTPSVCTRARASGKKKADAQRGG